MLVQTFYYGVKHAMRSMIDAVMGGTLRKTKDEAYNLIEVMALNNY